MTQAVQSGTCSKWLLGALAAMLLLMWSAPGQVLDLPPATHQVAASHPASFSALPADSSSLSFAMLASAVLELALAVISVTTTRNCESVCGREDGIAFSIRPPPAL